MMSNERDDLRRIAYGPDATATERTAAEAALRQLELAARVEEDAAHDDSRAKAHEPDEEVVAIVEDSDPASANDDSATEPSLWHLRIRVGWVVPIVIGFFLLGAGGTLGVTGQWQNTNFPEQGPAHGDAEADAKGDLAAADAPFKLEYTLKDRYPGPSILQSYGIDEHDVRFSGGYGVWFARTDTSLCLLVLNFDFERGAGCVTRAEFARSGIALTVGGLTFHWLGDALSESGKRPVEESVTPPTQDPGPSDLDAARAMFDESATDTDAFPMGEILDGFDIDSSDVRLIGGDEHGHVLWVGKQRTVGLCLITYDIRAGQSGGRCVEDQEFAATGLSFAIPGFAASWNGTGFATSGKFNFYTQ